MKAERIHPSLDVEDAVIVVPLWRRVLSVVLKTLLPLLILAAAAHVYQHLMATEPHAARKPETRIASLVEVVSVVPRAAGPVIEAWGEVVPARSLVLSPEVSGRVVWLNPNLRAGGRIAAGEEMLRLDNRQRTADLRMAEAEVARIDALILTEKGQAARALRDLERVPLTLTEEQRALVLREPQMAELVAQRDAALASRDQAAVALSEVVLRAPFDAVVTEADVAMGSMLAPTSAAATLVTADRAEVTLAVPVTALGWIDLAEGGEITLSQPGIWPQGAERRAQITRFGASLTEAGRMAEVIAVVQDPLALQSDNAGEPVVLIGSFLRAEIQGRAIEGAVAIDRAHLRDDDRVWVMGRDDRLEIRPVEVAWRGVDQVLIARGLVPGERVVATPLATVADGMALRLADSP
ncbi:MAG: efflux RND transporter periplasmic adaptor subunit [Pseudomonadota bacterium]